MKCEVMTSLVKLEKNELRVLCREVKETVATEFSLPVKEAASFNVADLWSVQQKMKTASSRWNRKSRTLYVRGY